MIDEEKLIEYANNHTDGKIDANDIARFPKEDVQPVVHCVKCKYRDKMEFCILNDIFINEKDFCSKGDKLDGDEHDNG